MKRNYIGLSCSGHDNALAIVDSAGTVRFAESAERYLQNKRALDAPPDDMFRIRAIVDEYVEPDAEIVPCKSWSDGAASVRERYRARAQSALARLHAQPIAGDSARAAKLHAFLIERERALLHMLELWSHADATAGRSLSYHFAARVRDLRRYEHHRTHAAAACFTSPFADAICVVVDGIGEGGTVSCYDYRDGALSPLPALAPGAADPLAGLGLFYTDLCTLCGFEHWSGDEWKVMGLAGYGVPDARVRKNLEGCLQLRGLGFERPPSEPAAIARLWQADGSTVRATIAHEGQRLFETLLIALCQHAFEVGRSTNLVLTGGCALNSSANGKLLEATRFERLSVPCAPADDGNAVGAALLAYYEDHPAERPRPGFQTPYLGSAIARSTLERAASSRALPHVRRSNSAELCREVALRLSVGEIVGWVQGRAEFGPRALGHRSILADPRDPAMKDRINAVVKLREGFRPFAPAVLAEHAATYFENYQPSPYMERALRFRPEVRARVPAVVHVDGTGRLQTVTRRDNPLFHALLTAFDDVTGVPMLLNTSFNVMGKPIVHSVEDALAVFTTSALDALVIDDYLFAKGELAAGRSR
jgi:carbamoyltransferase